VVEVEAALGGGSGPSAGTGANPLGLPPLGAQGGGAAAPQGAGGASAAGGDVTRVTAEVQAGMRRFEALLPQLQQLPRAQFDPIAQQAQRLHERFVALQQRGTQLGADGRGPMQPQAEQEYLSEMRPFVTDLSAFVAGLEQAVGAPAQGAPPATQPAAASGSGTGYNPLDDLELRRLGKA